MSETTEKTYTADELNTMWASLPDQLKDAINTLNTRIDEHNTNVALIKAASGDESKKLLFELRDQNPKDDPELAKYLAEITKLNGRIEDLMSKANAKAEEVYAESLKIPTEDEVKKARDSVSKSGAELRTGVKSMVTFEDLMGVPLSVHIKQVGSLKGTGAKSSSSGGEIWRPRTSAIYVNGELVQQEVQNPKTGVKEPKSTLNILASHLNKLVNEKHFSTVDLQAEYLKAAGGDKDNIPEAVPFEISFTKGENTVTFNVVVNK